MINEAPLKRITLLTGVIVAVTVITLFLLPKASGQPPKPQLRLHRGTFDAQERRPSAANEVFDQVAPGPYAIIQFRGPVTPADRAMLSRTGITILEYLPDFAFLVEGTDAQLATASTLSRTYARVPFTLADKLSPSLLRANQSGQTTVGRQHIVAWSGKEEALARELDALSFNAEGDLSVSQVVQIGSLTSVRWIEPLGRPRIVNDVARSIMGVNSAWQNAPVFGSGQIVGIADSGLDTGVQDTLSLDFAGRVLATYGLAPGGDWADQHGHGTHVAGSLAGSGAQSGAQPAHHDYATSFAGVAPEASLVIQGFEVLADGSIVGLPEDYYQLFNQVYTDGVRLHSNSWADTTGLPGDPSEFGGYVYGTQRTDEFVWDHPDTTIFAAAGNSGKDGVPSQLEICLGNGVIDPDSLLSPGTAKNVVTVGASESTRNSGPALDWMWLMLDLCFWTSPIAGDLIANNANGMAAFSSRGPADDGRTKPDIVAPGVNIISNRSHNPAAGSLWGPYNDHYVYSGGSSMSTPLVAGMATLVREWLTRQGATNPSAALVKAILLNTTHDMAPGQYGTGSTREIPYSRPNNVAGWGRADLGFMNPPPYYSLWFDDHTGGLITGELVSYTHTISQPLQVLTDTMPLRIMLTWTDPPASLSAAAQLVNDLDLVVTGPGGTYYGNNVSTGDRTNNVEGIVISNPQVGHYTVNVSAHNVPVANQPYGLVVAGPLSPPDRLAISHDPATSFEVDTALPITATVTSESLPFTVTLHYSATNDIGYTSLSMVNTAGDVYSAIVPAGAVITPTLSYYIKASNNTKMLIDGPHQVSITLPSADLSISKDDNLTTASPGDPVTYTISISNSGPSYVRGATIVDVLPADLVGESWTCSATGGASCAASGTGDINQQVDLPAGGVLNYTVSAAFGLDAHGPVSNSATVTPPVGTSDPDLTDNSATDTTVIESIFGNSYKQVQPSNFQGGDTLTYAIAIRNESAGPRMVNLVDPIPGNTTYVAGSGHASDGSTPVLAGQELVWHGQVTPDTPVYVQFSVVTTTSLPVDAVIANSATLTDEGGEVVVLRVEAVHNPGYLLTVDEGAIFTKSPEVDLRYAWQPVDDVSKIQFSNDGAFPSGEDTSDWLPVNGTDPTYTGWRLSTYGNYVLPRTVYARFKDDGGLLYGPIQDDIVYDPISPTVVDVSVSFSDQANSSPISDLRAAPDLSATVVVTATDEQSGVEAAQLSHSAGFETYESFLVTGAETKIPWSLGPSGLVYVRAVDRAGNVSDVKMSQGAPNYLTFLPSILR